MALISSIRFLVCRLERVLTLPLHLPLSCALLCVHYNKPCTVTHTHSNAFDQRRMRYHLLSLGIYSSSKILILYCDLNGYRLAICYFSFKNVDVTIFFIQNFTTSNDSKNRYYF